MLGASPPPSMRVWAALCRSGQLPGPPASLAGWCLLFAVACCPRVAWCLPSGLVLKGLGGWLSLFVKVSEGRAHICCVRSAGDGLGSGGTLQAAL